MTKVTKTSITIRVMTENADKPMDEVVKLIAAANSVTEQVAKGAYRYMVKNDLAPGKLEGKVAVKKAAAKAVKPAKAPKAAKPPKAVKPAAPEKSADELARIKAANSKRLKEVLAKKPYLKGQIADGVRGVPEGFDPDEAREEVRGMIESLDSFKAPKFLSKDQVKALV